MSMTLTVRTDDQLGTKLRELAKAREKTVSAVVREILEEAIADKPISVRAGHLKAQMNLNSDDDSWRNQLRERNWRA
jgi:predicted transcriptional regulator